MLRREAVTLVGSKVTRGLPHQREQCVLNGEVLYLPVY
jgi:hypothetical protein